MKKIILTILGILFISGLFLSVNANDDDFTGSYVCKYYMKGRDNNCLIKVGTNKMVSPNCSFLTPQKMNILINNSQKCRYIPIYKENTEIYTCNYKAGKCTVTVKGNTYLVKCCSPNISNERVMEDFQNGECVKEKSAK